MTLRAFLEAVAGKLTALWPERKVYVDEMPRDADGNFFVRIVDSSEESHLDRRGSRTLSFEVLYFMRQKETLPFLDWAEAMYDAFKILSVEETAEKTRGIYLYNREARRNDNLAAYQFTFDAAFQFVVAPEEEIPMERLDQREEVGS